MTPNDHSAALTAVPMTDQRGRPCLGVPLTGRDGEGRFALLDEAGLARLRQHGARALYLVNDGDGREYPTFVARGTASRRNRAMLAARVIAGDPRGRRVDYRSGDRLDLRRENLWVREYAGVAEG